MTIAKSTVGHSRIPILPRRAADSDLAEGDYRDRAGGGRQAEAAQRPHGPDADIRRRQGRD